MNTHTHLHLVPSEADGEEYEATPTPLAEQPEPAYPTTTTEPVGAVPSAAAAGRRRKPEGRFGTPPSPLEPKPGGPYRFGAGIEQIGEKVSASLQPPLTPPSLTTVEAKYPHVLQRIRDAWRDPEAFHLLINDLLLPSRQGRAGFAPEALMELTRLKEHYALVVANEGRQSGGDTGGEGKGPQTDD